MTLQGHSALPLEARVSLREMMIKIKNILNDLTSYVYKENQRLDKYLRFYVEISQNNMKTVHGRYWPTKNRIEIFNLYRDDAAVIATTVHELAHHIDCCNRGDSDHSKEFYAVYRELLYGSLDMKLFSKNEFLEANRDASDSNKVVKMITDYSPQDVGYKKEVQTIQVFHCFQIKEQLKERGYSWNPINKCWEKEVLLADVNDEQRFLESVHAEYEVNINNRISFTKTFTLIAGKGSYERREELKADGFYYQKERKFWKKEFKSADEVNECRRKYPDIEWKSK